jgi:hypothetical protein
MNEKTKKILIRRRTREVFTVKQNEPTTFVCEHCGTEQTFKLVENANNKLLNKGENNNENNNQTR